MLILLDTANLEKIKRLNDLYPLDGVTTNPSIISKENKDFLELLAEIRNIIGEDKMLHAQVLSTKAEEMIEEAEFLAKKFGENLYIKIPVIPEGIKAIKNLSKQGVKITATAVFTPQQAFMAAKAGADFVAPYVNRLDNISADGIKVVAEIIELFKVHRLDTKVIAASFKNINQIHQCLLQGSQAVTANPDLIEKLVYHPMTNLGVEGFIADWERVYGEGKKVNNL
ncbi:fructose-6-phosphate aldolase 2 [Orenia metallireducens]|uniref:fructose-6-phosphate aldolase n=1 Tax=Orenia metallireducens TaxID=1413210 RepID=UPI000D065C9C|nr:fructose-6-phosphate aldolase [Orenia metallireducens]PRX26921.1 fructose-6-phosphate aldolase 2 [Orenia metallireducens]